jgi:hypothetical protein
MKKFLATMGAIIVGAGLLIAPSGAAVASGGEKGQLLIHGPGSVYAGVGDGAYISEVASAAGGTVTYSFEIKNTGPNTAQYNVTTSNFAKSCDPSGCPTPTVVVSAGSLVVSKLAAGPNGYYTAPIDPGKVAVYSLTVTTPKTALPNNGYLVRLDLKDTAGTPLDFAYALTTVKSGAGTTAYDQFLSTSGQGPILGRVSTSDPLPLESTPLAIGQTATFTVKLQNNSASPTAIHYQLSDLAGCGNYYTLTVKAGITDVTALVVSGGYTTPTLAKAGATTLTVTIKYIASAAACTSNWQYWSGTSSDGNGNTESVYILVDRATGS